MPPYHRFQLNHQLHMRLILPFSIARRFSTSARSFFVRHLGLNLYIVLPPYNEREQQRHSLRVIRYQYHPCCGSSYTLPCCHALSQSLYTVLHSPVSASTISFLDRLAPSLSMTIFIGQRAPSGLVHDSRNLTSTGSSSPFFFLILP